MFYAYHELHGISRGVRQLQRWTSVGVQIISSRFREDVILNACEEIERSGSYG